MSARASRTTPTFGRLAIVAGATIAATFVGVALAEDAAALKLFAVDPRGDAPPSAPSPRVEWMDDSVDDEHVVLVVRDDVVGAFVLSGQQNDPVATKVRWIFRKGPAGPFDSKDKACTTGGAWITKDEDFRIRFGPFDVAWDRGFSEHGRLGYSKDWKTGLCITTSKSFEGLDPTRSDWVYLRYPKDRGVAFAKDEASVKPRPRLSPVAPQTDAAPTKSAGVTQNLRDGTVVLLVSGGRCAALILTEQRCEQVAPGRFTESAKYEWWLRRDGFGRLDPSDPAVDHGASRTVSSSGSFGGFWLEWWWVEARGDAGWGALVYPLQRRHGEHEDTFICVTDRKDLVGLDAQDPKWIYKRSADDPGWRFEKAK